MSVSRRFLPSMSLLCAFEAAARHQSFTAAAAELHLTQSAISRQVRALEEAVGSNLFVRERQTVTLTLAGEAYAQEIREALSRISKATLNFKANPTGGTLKLGILPTFGTRWLAPRLPQFTETNPGITLNLSTRLARFDFGEDQLDAAIHFGAPHWPGAELDFLMSETVVPACSQALARKFDLSRPEGLLEVPLIHLESRPDAWERWFRNQGVVFPPLSGMLIDQFAIASQAAIGGLGVALLPRFLIEAELARGDLVEPLDAPMESTERYYLAWPSKRTAFPPLQAFRQWLRRVTAA
ncbi:LysR family transcriptional regulator [Aureimonas psammosilenae]|uniref:LysR family transcriptional regulator n=1 Tax=Aureimonas psammosilenae TaxID=2495496 RepID=UPI001260D8FB|nr:LysR family transcriptional regulator [Aureimonas psammosilenae]